MLFKETTGPIVSGNDSCFLGGESPLANHFYGRLKWYIGHIGSSAVQGARALDTIKEMIVKRSNLSHGSVVLP